MSTLPLVAIIILNWKQRELTLACLESVMCLDYPAERFKIVMVDNASQDGSVEAVREAYPGVIVIENPENQGYAGGNNVGIRWALERGADYVLILNNDVLLDQEMVTYLVSMMEFDKKIGIAGPLVFHADEPGIIQSAGCGLGKYWQPAHLQENQPDTGQLTKPHEVDWLTGCALLVRPETIRQSGTLDERFFSYYEDLDWCLCISKAGWKVLIVPEAKIWHKGVQRKYQPRPYVTYYMTRNKLLLLKKHHAPSSVWLWTLSGMLKTITSWSVKPKWHSKVSHRNAMLQGMMDYYRKRWGKVELSE